MVRPVRKTASGFRLTLRTGFTRADGHAECVGVAIEPARAGWRLSCAQRVPRPLAEVFPFLATGRNLERITPAFLRFRSLHMSSEPLAAGVRIECALRLHGVPVRW